MRQVCDYEGSKYRTDFWEGQNREYEDQVERVAMQKLLPPTGHRLLEVGTGFGRLVDLYNGYDQVILLDYAHTQLQEAQAYLGNDERFIFVVADVYNLPFVDNLFNALTIVRVMHHLADVPSALRQLHRVITPQGVAIIEHASKFHLKSIARWALGRQPWNPFDPAPIEFVKLNFDFHPAWMRQQCEAVGLSIQSIRTLSHFRINLLKQTLPTSLLVALDSLAQPTGMWWQLSPSIFLQAEAQKPLTTAAADFFQCPNCKLPLDIDPYGKTTSTHDRVIDCPECRFKWQFRNGIYNFRTPIATP